MHLNENYIALANAIIKQAAEDFRVAAQKGDEGSRRKIEKFFRSPWFSVLTDLDGDFLLKRLEREFEASRPKRFFVARNERRYDMKPTEKKLYDFLKNHDGMTLFEEDIRNNLNISHGTFSAARKALVEAGVLFMERRGKAVFYRILPETSEVKETSISPKTSLTAKTSTKTSTAKTSNLPLNDSSIEPVTGFYADFDDWFLALTRAYGDVDAEERSGGKYLVTTFEPFSSVKYETYTDDEGSFVVNLA